MASERDQRRQPHPPQHPQAESCSLPIAAWKSPPRTLPRTRGRKHATDLDRGVFQQRRRPSRGQNTLDAGPRPPRTAQGRIKPVKKSTGSRATPADFHWECHRGCSSRGKLRKPRQPEHHTVPPAPRAVPPLPPTSLEAACQANYSPACQVVSTLIRPAPCVPVGSRSEEIEGAVLRTYRSAPTAGDALALD